MANEYRTFHWFDLIVRGRQIPLNTFGAPETSVRAGAYKIDDNRTIAYLKRNIYRDSIQTASTLQVMPVKDVDGVKCYTVKIEVLRQGEKVTELNPVIPVKSVKSPNQAAWHIARKVLEVLKDRVYRELDRKDEGVPEAPVEEPTESLGEATDLPF